MARTIGDRPFVIYDPIRDSFSRHEVGAIGLSSETASVALFVLTGEVNIE